MVPSNHRSTQDIGFYIVTSALLPRCGITLYCTATVLHTKYRLLVGFKDWTRRSLSSSRNPAKFISSLGMQFIEILGTSGVPISPRRMHGRLYSLRAAIYIWEGPLSQNAFQRVANTLAELLFLSTFQIVPTMAGLSYYAYGMFFIPYQSSIYLLCGYWAWIVQWRALEKIKFCCNSTIALRIQMSP